VGKKISQQGGRKKGENPQKNFKEKKKKPWEDAQRTPKGVSGKKPRGKKKKKGVHPKKGAQKTPGPKKGGC